MRPRFLSLFWLRKRPRRGITGSASPACRLARLAWFVVVSAGRNHPSDLLVADLLVVLVPMLTNILARDRRPSRIARCAVDTRLRGPLRESTLAACGADEPDRLTPDRDTQHVRMHPGNP
jgi:hypothetical protein